jgi:hypothetical protein
MTGRRSRAFHRSILVFDTVDSTTKDDYVQEDLQRRANSLVHEALDAAAVDSADCAVEDRGDGTLLVLPADASKADVTDALLATLGTGLRRLNATANDHGRLRLRVALHCGDVVRNEEGWRGGAVVTTFRLNTAAAVREALTGAPDAVMALVVSDRWFDDAIRPGWALTDAADFQPRAIPVGDTVVRAWITAPIHTSTAKPRSNGGEAASVTAVEQASGEAPPQPPSQGAVFHGPVRVGRDFIHGDKIEHHGTQGGPR